MPAWIYVLAACAVAWVVFVAVFHPFRRGAHAAPRALPVRVDAGSMVLAEERTAWLSAPPWEPTDGCVVPSSPKSASAALAMKTGIGTPYGGQLEPRALPVREHIHNGSCADDRCWDGGPGRAPLAPLGGQLGPRARAVLDRYNARCVERWGHAIAG